MTALMCVLSTAAVCLAPPPADAPTHALHHDRAASVRGGHADPLPARGGAALVVLDPIGDLAAWTCIHQHEAAWNDSGDPYWGGLQMDRNFMTTYGSDMVRKYGGWADRWSPRDQMVVAERARASGRGYHPWPNTARTCGYL